MTANAFVWTVAISLWAGIIALVSAVAINRFTRRVREPESEPPHRTPAAVAAARDLLLRLVPGPLRDRTPQHEGEPHTGATEDFGDELRALADLPPAPELVSDVETDLRWAQIWHDYEHDLRVQIDEVFAPHLSALTGPLDAKTCMELDAVMAATGEFERAELDELLAVTG